MIIKQFYRPDRAYWYKLVIFKGKFYIFYDFREGKVGSRIRILEHNKTYVYNNIDEALKTFNSWEHTYGRKDKI